MRKLSRRSTPQTLGQAQLPPRPCCKLSKVWVPISLLLTRKSSQRRWIRGAMAWFSRATLPEFSCRLRKIALRWNDSLKSAMPEASIHDFEAEIHTCRTLPRMVPLLSPCKLLGATGRLKRVTWEASMRITSIINTDIHGRGLNIHLLRRGIHGRYHMMGQCHLEDTNKQTMPIICRRHFNIPQQEQPSQLLAAARPKFLDIPRRRLGRPCAPTCHTARMARELPCQCPHLLVRASWKEGVRVRINATTTFCLMSLHDPWRVRSCPPPGDCLLLMSARRDHHLRPLTPGLMLQGTDTQRRGGRSTRTDNR